MANKSLIIVNNEDLRIRPSAVESFYGCAFAWGKTFLEGVQGRAASRSSIGTSIHAGVEKMWQDAIASGKKDPNLSAMTDAAMEAWKEEAHDGMQYNKDENEESCANEIIAGTAAFVEDIVPFTSIPNAVEEFYKIDITGNAFVKELGGTVDYISDDTIADVKTSKRKSAAEKHTVQQTIYTILAQANGVDVKNNLIQQVVLKKNPEGAILQLEPDFDQAKFLVNGILDTMDLIAKDVAPIHHILRPNPGHMFCSGKFCAHYQGCPAVRGNLAEHTQIPVNVKL